MLSGTWRLVYSSGFASGSLGGQRPGPPAALVPVTIGQVRPLALVSSFLNDEVQSPSGLFRHGCWSLGNSIREAASLVQPLCGPFFRVCIFGATAQCLCLINWFCRPGMPFKIIYEYQICAVQQDTSGRQCGSQSSCIGQGILSKAPSRKENSAGLCARPTRNPYI